MARTLLILALALATACSDDTNGGWKFDESPNNDPSNNQDPGTTPDDPDTTPDDPDPDPPELCEAEALELGPPTFLPGSPQMAGRSVVTTELGLGSVFGGTTVHLRAEDGSTPSFELEQGALVVGAGGPTVVATGLADDPTIYAYNLVVGGVPFELTEGPGPNLAYINPWDGAYPTMVDTDGSAAFVGDGRIHMWDTVEVYFIAEAGPYTFEIGEGRVVWIEQLPDGPEVTSWTFNQSETVDATPNDQPFHLEVFAEGTYWGSREELWVWLEGSEPEQIGGICTPPSFDRSTRKAYYACSDNDEFAGPYTIFERELNGQTEPIWTSMLRPYGLVARDGIVVWAEYLPGSDTGFETGQLYGWARGMELPQKIDEIGQGCLSCGAYWKPSEIVMNGGFLAWSYADNPPPFDETQTHVEVREISILCR